jgi:hypothetical protein
VVSVHPTAEEAFAALDTLRVWMTRNGTSADALELLVIDQRGLPVKRRAVD